MKRVIQCPKCQAKLAVFDIGKPINQKCPKCGNAFVVDSEEAKPAADAKPDADAKPVAPVATEPAAVQPDVAKPKSKKMKAAESKAEAKAEAKPETKVDEKGEGTAESKTEAAPAPKTEAGPDVKPDAKEEPKAAPKTDIKASEVSKPAPKSALPKPAATPSLEPEFPEHHCGVSFLHLVVIIGLLMLVIVMQVLAKKNMERRFINLEAQLSDVHKALSNQIIKSK